MEKHSENVLLSDVTEKTTVSARVNNYLIEQYKDCQIPVSLAIECSLINFMKLNDIEKIKFLSSNLPDKVKVSELKKPKKVWKELLNDYVKKLSIPSALSAGLISGVSIGAIALIGGLLSSLGDKVFDIKD
jgi:hypothetical protein